jgi:hypothetical protein
MNQCRNILNNNPDTQQQNNTVDCWQNPASSCLTEPKSGSIVGALTIGHGSRRATILQLIICSAVFSVAQVFFGYLHRLPYD